MHVSERSSLFGTVGSFVAVMLVLAGGAFGVAQWGKSKADKDVQVAIACQDFGANPAESGDLEWDNRPPNATLTVSASSGKPAKVVLSPDDGRGFEGKITSGKLTWSGGKLAKSSPIFLRITPLKGSPVQCKAAKRSGKLSEAAGVKTIVFRGWQKQPSK